MQPPQDDLFAVMDEYVTDVQEGDVIAISSKIISIHEGNCVLAAETDKAALVRSEADVSIDRPYWSSPLTIIKSAFIGTAGIDESNANGYLIKLPTDAFASAKNIHTYVQKRFNVQNVGVLITDSHSSPMRRGAIGVSIGWWGFRPTINHVGEEDLFGRELQVEVSNIADGLAAAATVVMGETTQSQPIVILRDAPDLSFTEDNTKDELFVPFDQDTFRVLYEKHLPPK